MDTVSIDLLPQDENVFRQTIRSVIEKNNVTSPTGKTLITIFDDNYDPECYFACDHINNYKGDMKSFKMNLAKFQKKKELTCYLKEIRYNFGQKHIVLDLTLNGEHHYMIITWENNWRYSRISIKRNIGGSDWPGFAVNETTPLLFKVRS